ncbi:putative aspartokinase [uncultured archaeon]|nr:putative aspartokinase [uncultured archaeon]
MDLAYFGAKVIHSKMIEPAMASDIPVWVKNTFNPSCKGTLIVRKQKKVDSVIKAVAVAKNIVIISVQGVGLMDAPNIAGRIFHALGEKGINIPMISGSSESNLSFVIAKNNLAEAMELLRAELGDGIVKGINVLEQVCIVTVVGAGMAGSKGTAAKLFQTVTDARANIIMIAQGSSEVSIAFVVGEEDAKNVVSVLHKTFIEAV